MALLEIENIHKRFGKTEVLKGISFSVDKGEVLSILGSSGGGKTTLLRCINFLETPDTGKMKIGGKEIFNAENKDKVSEKQIRENRQAN